MSPFDYVQRVTKHLLTDLEKTSDTWSETWVPFSTKHPQFSTHVQVVRDVSNPRVSHPVPVLVGYTLPPRSEDPEKYALVIMSLLTPHSIGGMIKADPSHTWAKTLDRYLKAVEIIDPHRHRWLTNIVYNMQSISNGRAQQKIERIERERLRQEQGLSEPIPEGPNDYDPNEHNETDIDNLFNGDSVSEDLIDVLPSSGPWTQDHAPRLASTLSLYNAVHHSRLVDQPGGRSSNSLHCDRLSPELKSVLKTQSDHLKRLLLDKCSSMYSTSSEPDPDVHDNDDITRSRKTFTRFIKAYNLDEDQTTSFITIAEHIIKVDMYQRKLSTFKPKQMIFYLGGEGGTGKSEVLKALVAFLDWTNLRHSIRMGAKTGSAAANIGGSTLHSLLSLKLHTRKKSTTDRLHETAIPEKLKGQYRNVNILFIDEISMISCDELHDISKKLTNIKTVKGTDQLLPFGGMTTILAGDFYQLRPFGGCPLYDSPNTSVSDKAGENLTKSLQGFHLFASVTHVVFLKTQYRMRKDKEYMDFVNRFRTGEQDVSTDEPYLSGKVVTADLNLRTGLFKDCPTDPVVIVATNDLRYHINMTKAAALSRETKRKLYISVARDTCTGHTLGTSLRRDLLLKPDGSSTGYGAGLLPLVVGMPVMVKTNIATELNVSNGSMGTVTRIILDERERVVGGNNKPHYCRYEPVVYIKLPDCDFQIPGLDPGEIPISTSTKQFKQNHAMSFKHVVNVGGQKIQLNIQRKQLWILPAFAITVDSSQGRTLDAAIIDLSGHHTTAQKPYVMLSRLSAGTWLGIQSGWEPSLWNVKPNSKMVKFIKTLLRKEEETKKTCKTPTAMNQLMAKYFNPKTCHRHSTVKPRKRQHTAVSHGHRGTKTSTQLTPPVHNKKRRIGASTSLKRPSP